MVVVWSQSVHVTMGMRLTLYPHHINNDEEMQTTCKGQLSKDLPCMYSDSA